MGTNGPRSSSVHDESSRRGNLSQDFKMNVGTDIESENSNWVFDEKVAPNFDKHVRESVPLYDYVQELAAKLSDWFVYEGARVVDLGAATGETMIEIRKRQFNHRRV